LFAPALESRRGDYTDQEATGDHETLVFIARKPVGVASSD
jgi:hypothetical protein